MTAGRRGLAAAIVALSVSVGGAGEPAEPTPEQLRDRYAALIASDWFAAGGWTEDYDAALARAKETGRPILAYFTRSYAP